MASLYFLSFRDVSSTSTGVTAGEVYVRDVDPTINWTTEVIAGGDWVAWDQVPNLFRGKRVCFVVHGFNVTLPAGVQSCGPLAQSFEDLGAFALNMTGADIVVPVLWPGDGFITWSYLTAYGHAQDSGKRFADFLASSAFNGSEVSFISHSLGAMIVLETVSQALATYGAPRAPFVTAILMAAAVDDTALDDPAYAAVTGANGLKRIIVLSSMTDQVLKVWFALGDTVEGALWWNYDADARALGRYGPAFTTGSTAQPLTEWYSVNGSQDHGDYLPVGGAPPLQGWTSKPEAVGLFCRDAFNRSPFAEPPLLAWATDNTVSAVLAPPFQQPFESGV